MTATITFLIILAILYILVQIADSRAEQRYKQDVLRKLTMLQKEITDLKEKENAQGNKNT